LFAVQPENCAPLHASYRAGGESLVMVDVKPTFAEGTAIARPIRTREVLQALRRSGGQTATVTEDEIVTAVKELGRMGLFVEPTSAIGPAALSHLIESGAIARSETTVVLLTGSGLKAAAQIGNWFGVATS
jgi:threonine synthase